MTTIVSPVVWNHIRCHQVSTYHRPLRASCYLQSYIYARQLPISIPLSLIISNSPIVATSLLWQRLSSRRDVARIANSLRDMFDIFRDREECKDWLPELKTVLACMLSAEDIMIRVCNVHCLDYSRVRLIWTLWFRSLLSEWSWKSIVCFMVMWAGDAIIYCAVE